MAEKGARILVIDDEKSVCISCKKILAEEHHEVDYECSALDGLSRAIEQDYDLLLLDLKMPEMSGMEFLELIKKEKPDATVVIITGYATIQTSIEAIKKGAFDYVPKPFTPEELLVTVGKALETARVRGENEFLKQEIFRLKQPMRILGRSKAIEDVRKQILKVAPTCFNVTIYGESGTGKELIAYGIHEYSDRSAKPFIAVDISTLSPTLVESELFGHVKGAFTGATQSRPGYFALAHGGTLFIDEICNTTPELQGKLLRVLDTRRMRPVGGKTEQEVDIRLVTATNRNLYELVEKGGFREDLYYRINVLPIVLPPLRERSEDIPLLATHFLEETKNQTHSQIRGFDTQAMAKLISYDWPGNVRQLKNLVERMVATVSGELIRAEHLPPEIGGTPSYMQEVGVESVPQNVEELKEAKRRLKDLVYEQIEKQFLVKALERHNGNVSQAAEEVGMQRTNFHALMRRYGIRVRDLSLSK